MVMQRGRTFPAEGIVSTRLLGRSEPGVFEEQKGNQYFWNGVSKRK